MTNVTSGATCPVCAKGHCVRVLLLAQLNIFRCEQCGFAFCDLPEDDHVAARIIEEKYDPPEVVAADHARMQRPEFVAGRRALLSRAAALFGAVDKPTMLDIGCGTGDLVAEAQALGWQAKGVELSRARATFAHTQGLDVYLGPLQSCSFARQSFDLVVVKNTLASVVQLQDFVAQAVSFLRPGGLLYILTVNFDAWLRRLLGVRWVGLQLGVYRWFFSVTSLKILLAQHELKEKQVETRSLYNDYFLGALHALRRRMYVQTLDHAFARTQVSSGARRWIYQAGHLSYYLGGCVPYWLLTQVAKKQHADAVIEGFYQKP